ncbi:DUF6438 domain-containing protein [Chryseobacterium sp. OSA05B]|uniref:DUF6438 domain-containing protein n=1 Tax=Chryseobacterium sp. OSA05B TaxID=2862650 RepID=UPI001CBD3FC2|nr:DUF6438 domain-containing protein [Chryseobacterium sp. OSA05B]
MLSFLSLVSLYSQGLKRTNSIDSLQTAEDVQQFIGRKEITQYVSVTDKIKYDSNCIAFADSLKIQPWIKGDFDGNGLTDILITGKKRDGPATICILDKGSGFETKQISNGQLHEICSFTQVKDNQLEYLSIKNEYLSAYKLKKDLLVYKFGDFIEENNAPKNHRISAIEFRASGCYGICPDFTLKISGLDIEWTAGRYNTVNFQEYSGVYHSKLSEERLKNILELLNYMDFENLDENYKVGYSDQPTAYLTIDYDDLKSKNIRDYGMMGTRGLRKLYEVLFDLRGELHWKKLSKIDNR